jgi:predicted nucleic acid-binding protein
VIYVIDASVALKWFLKNEAHPNADAVLKKLIYSPEIFAVPELFLFETFAVICRHHPHPLEVFVKGLCPLMNNGVMRHPMTEGLAGIAYDFVKKGLTGYDSCYAALALDLKGKWLTFDEKAHGKISKTGISINLFKTRPFEDS